MNQTTTFLIYILMPTRDKQVNQKQSHCPSGHLQNLPCHLQILLRHHCQVNLKKKMSNKLSQSLQRKHLMQKRKLSVLRKKKIMSTLKQTKKQQKRRPIKKLLLLYEEDSVVKSVSIDYFNPKENETKDKKVVMETKMLPLTRNVKLCQGGSKNITEVE